MPGMSGPALAEKLAVSHPEMNLLCMSGYTDYAVGRHGILESGILLLEKPYTHESLTRKVRAVLALERVTD
jgi:two-component system, cell cycle sensor histidine kinase and response regulator CckA